jgi:hypothetical protein
MGNLKISYVIGRVARDYGCRRTHRGYGRFRDDLDNGPGRNRLI